MGVVILVPTIIEFTKNSDPGFGAYAAALIGFATLLNAVLGPKDWLG